MPDQGTIRQRGCNPLSGSFFGSFLEKQKRTTKTAGCNISISVQNNYTPAQLEKNNQMLTAIYPDLH
jgi:hypothetical protein